MHIRSLQATFGKLENQALSLSPGLNIICAPNESGKTTWCRFLVSMLYGINTRDRSLTADKNRYLPWSGAAIQGRMDFEAGGTAYTVTRSCRRSGTFPGDFRYTYYNGTDVPGDISAADFGEALLGVSREVFERSAFISQGALPLQQNAQLERRIISLITTGEESVSCSKTQERLKMQFSRRHRECCALERDIASLQQQAREAEQLIGSAIRIQQQLEEAQEELRKLQDHAALWKTIDEQNRYRNALRERQGVQRHLQELLRQAAKSKAALKEHPLYAVKPQDIQLRLHPVPPKKPVSFWIPLIPTVLLAAGSMLQRLPPWSLILLLLCVIGGGITSVLLFLRHRSYQRALIRQAADVSAFSENCSEFESLRQQAIRAAEAAKQGLDLYHSLPPLTPVDLTETPVPSSGPEEVAQQLVQQQELISQLRSQADMSAGQLRALGSADNLTAELTQKEAQYGLAQRESEALSTAMAALDEAEQTLQRRFSPVLGQKTAEIFSRFTGGKYGAVVWNRDFSMQVEPSNDPIMRPMQYLSQGAADQLYLAARLALCRTVFPPDRSVPLILDDALMSFDDQRLQVVLDHLWEESRQRQILLFTCQRREAEYLQNRENVNIIELYA